MALSQQSLYGLRQAPNLWYHHFSKTILKIKFCRSKFSDSFVACSSPHEKMFGTAYRDDLLVFGTVTAGKTAKIRLSKLVATTDLGVCSHFLRIKFERSRVGLFLCLKAYIKQTIQNA